MPLHRPASGRSTTSKPLRARVWTAGRVFVLVIALLATYGAFFLTALRVANRAREVKVPDVRGHTLTDAKALVDRAGLVLKVDARRPDPKVPADHVLTQEPDPGTSTRTQRTVRVRVSEGQHDPPVPSVVGQPERTAELVLAEAKVEIASRTDVRSRGYPADTVVAQDPPARTQSAKVSLLINRGDTGESYVMPDVIGAVSSRAVDLLRQHGFRVTVSAEVPYPGLAPGIVVRQTPQAGFQIASGAPVQLEVSR